MKVLKKKDSQATQTENKIVEDDDAEIRLDNMEKLLHFRDNLKTQKPLDKTESVKENTSTSDIADPEKDIHPDVLEARSMQDGGYRLPHPIWTDDEVNSVLITHRVPVTVCIQLVEFLNFLPIFMMNFSSSHCMYEG